MEHWRAFAGIRAVVGDRPRILDREISWQRGFGQPLWLITDLQPEQALRPYQQRMKIEESFRGLNNLLGLDKVMSQRRDYLEQVLALVMKSFQEENG
jgi:transposase